MIRVLCISVMPQNAPTGVVTHYKSLCKHFSNDSDIKVDLLTVSNISWLQEKVSGLARRVISTFSFGNKNIIKYSIDTKNKLQINYALKNLNNTNYDIIHAQDILSGCVAKEFFKGQVPLILTCHFNDNPVEEDMITYQFDEKCKTRLIEFYRQKFSNVDKFIFVSRYVYEKSKHLLKEKAYVDIIHNGVRFQQVQLKKNENAKLHLINVGIIEERKNQKILIELALRLIKKNLTDFIITIVGNGPSLSNIKRDVALHGLESHFLFPGWTNNINQYLLEADLYIHTSINDNCPYSVIEAISKKVPVIAFCVGGLPEIVDREYLFELNDLDSMVEFIDQNRFKLPQIGTYQYNKIERTFSMDEQFLKIKNLYLTYAKVKESLVTECPVS